MLLDGLTDKRTREAAPLTFRQVLAETLAAWVRSGGAAVAPVLEPYVGATHWPSGAPLPLDLVYATERRCARLLAKRACFQFLEEHYPLYIFACVYPYFCLAPVLRLGWCYPVAFLCINGAFVTPVAVCLLLFVRMGT